jgi:hypothetical protein
MACEKGGNNSSHTSREEAKRRLDNRQTLVVLEPITTRISKWVERSFLERSSYVA